MTDYALEVRHLGKHYRRYGGRTPAYGTLRDSISSGVRELGSRLRAIADSSQVRSRDGFWALRDVSFSLAPGDVLGVIGRNGAGKSTLLKILGRITPPSEGKAVLKGRVASLLEVGTGFHRELTGRENIFLNGAILGMSRREIRGKLDEIVAFAEIEQFLDTPVKFFSSGMYVRLAFAVAATLDVDVLLVDEVLAVGDAEFQRRCLGRMKDMSGSGGRTVLFVSHSMPAVRALCPYTLWLDHGSARELGPTADVISRYLGQAMSAGGVSDTAAVKRLSATHGEKLRIERVTLNDGGPVVHGEELRVAIDFRSDGPLHNVSFGLGFASADGVRLLTVDSDHEHEGRDLHNSAGRVDALIPSLPLEPGVYAVDVAARTGVSSDLDYLPGCLLIHILPGIATSGALLREGGGVRLPALWQWRDGA